MCSVYWYIASFKQSNNRIRHIYNFIGYLANSLVICDIHKGNTLLNIKGHYRGDEMIIRFTWLSESDSIINVVLWKTGRISVIKVEEFWKLYWCHQVLSIKWHPFICTPFVFWRSFLDVYLIVNLATIVSFNGFGPSMTQVMLMQR